MMNLPETYQGMKAFVRYASKEIERSHQKIEELKLAIGTLKGRMRIIEEQKGFIDE